CRLLALRPFPTRRSSDLLERRILLSASALRIQLSGSLGARLIACSAASNASWLRFNRLRTSERLCQAEAIWGFNFTARSYAASRSEEHTSELQSPYDLVC